MSEAKRIAELPAALRADLAAEPTHAYLLTGPTGSGKGAAARMFAAEVLAAGAPDPASARSRALADPSPHPDLTWVEPAGNQHLVATIRERVIFAAPYSPFEGSRRVFVIAAADALAEESQNALLATLEEPPGHAYLILLSAEPAAILPTVRSRCREVRLAAPDEAGSASALVAETGTGELEALAAVRLAAGDLGQARFLLSDDGRALRAAITGCATHRGGPETPWRELLVIAERAGQAAAEALTEQAGELAGDAADEKAGERIRKDAEAAAKRAARRESTRVVALGLRVWAAWLRDLAAHAEGSHELLGADRATEIAAAASGIGPSAALEAAGLVAESGRRLRVNVSEELLLESLAARAARILA